MAGVSTSGKGVYGESTKGVAVHAHSLGSGLAGKFDGDVKITGTTTIKGPLEIDGATTLKGDLKITGDITDVNTITVHKDVVITGADCAEQFDMHDAAAPEPGTIVVIDDDGTLRECQSPYDKRVAELYPARANTGRPSCSIGGHRRKAGHLSPWWARCIAKWMRIPRR